MADTTLLFLGRRAPNNILIHATTVSAGHGAASAVRVMLRYNYSPFVADPDDFPDATPDQRAALLSHAGFTVPRLRSRWDANAENAMHGKGASVADADLPAIKCAVAALCALAGRDLPVQNNLTALPPGYDAWPAGWVSGPDLTFAPRLTDVTAEAR